ncbi:hypothetical protein B0H14DRAFT_2592950 [Mycena olivaceomarginata]|nr:hypothetical protein B0H14DRAFT_2592950 [Mycena olivaceomarginata]
MSQRHKSKNPEVRKVAQDIQEIVEGLDPAEKLPQKCKAEAVKSEPINVSLDSDDSDCAAASSSHTAKKTKRSASADADDLEAVEMSFCVYVENPAPSDLEYPQGQYKAFAYKNHHSQSIRVHVIIYIPRISGYHRFRMSDKHCESPFTLASVEI